MPLRDQAFLKLGIIHLLIKRQAAGFLIMHPLLQMPK
jgi:hypothetical protein